VTAPRNDINSAFDVAGTTSKAELMLFAPGAGPVALAGFGAGGSYEACGTGCDGGMGGGRMAAAARMALDPLRG